MSKDNTNYDVRVVTYDGSRQQIAHIIFFNDCEMLLECKRVKVIRDNNRLYFHKGDATAGSIKLSGKDCPHMLQLWKDFNKVKDMEGLYDLKYDKEQDLYYLDKDEKLTGYRHGTPKAGMKQLNHNPGNREKKGEQVMTVTVKKQIKEPVKKILSANGTENSVVVRALLTLLKDQVKGNADALSTIDVMEKFI